MPEPEPSSHIEFLRGLVDDATQSDLVRGLALQLLAYRLLDAKLASGELRCQGRRRSTT
jgi:hypothetical protein